MVTGQRARWRDFQWGRLLNEKVWFIALIVSVVVAHLGLLHVPYYWDEVYFASAARDFFLSGNPLPTSVPVESHPPLVLIWVAMWWKLFGFSIPVARVAMLAIATLTLTGVHRLARLLTAGAVPIAVTALTAVYPVFFSHSTMVTLDMAAGGAILWGLEAYLRGRTWRSALLFSLAVMAKDTAIVAPLALLALEGVMAIRHRICFTETENLQAWKKALPLLLPLATLLCWFAWLYVATGTLFGDSGYVESNLYEPLSPMRMVLACIRQLFHLLGYLNLFVLTLSTALICALRPLARARRTPAQGWRPWLVLGVVVAGYVAMHTIVGAVQLPRYLLPVDPLIILVSLALISSRVKWWPAVAGLTAVAFMAALFTYPRWYGLVLRDNLNYLDYAALHQQAATFLAKAPKARILTTYPASSELTEPWLGYTTQPLPASDIGTFTRRALTNDLHMDRPQSTPQYLVMFPTNSVPSHPFPRPRWWQNSYSLFSEDEELSSPEEVASITGARVVYFARRRGDWIAVLKLDSADNMLQNRVEKRGSPD